MKVILTKDVESLGDSGDIVVVADGFARNYLFPQNKAIEATSGALKDLQSRIERIRAKAEKKHQEDLGKASKVTGLKVLTLEAHAGESGKLFGAITTKELVKILNEKTGLEIERKNISLDHPINRVGSYSLHVRFSSKVTATLPVEVSGGQMEGYGSYEEEASYDESYSEESYQQPESQQPVAEEAEEEEEA